MRTRKIRRRRRTTATRKRRLPTGALSQVNSDAVRGTCPQCAKSQAACCHHPTYLPVPSDPRTPSTPCSPSTYQPHVIHDRPAPKEMCAARSWLVLTSTGRRLFGACGTVGTVAHTARRTDGRDFKHKHTRMYVCAARRGFSMTCARSATSTPHSSRRAKCGHKPLWPLAVPAMR